nr:ribonuclease H-like domain-containing protein [Tanacetum cinerariifolium]
MDKCKIRLGYNVVPRLYTRNFMPPKPDLVYLSLDDFVHVNESVNESVVEKPIVKSNEPKTVSKENGAPIIKDWVSKSEKEDEPKFQTGNSQQDLKDKGVINSECSRHMIGNRSYLKDYEEFDGGFVAFGENGNSFKLVPRTTSNVDGTSTSTIPGPVTTEEKRNKVDLDTMSIDDLYNNFKIVKQEIKRTVVSSSSSGSLNMAFLSSPGNTNEVDTASIQVSVVSTPISTVSSPHNTANLSDATMYAFMENQPNGSQLLALLSMRARRHFQKTGKKITIHRSDTVGPRNQDNSRKIMIMEDTSYKAMVAINGAGFDWSYMADDEVPTNMALMAFSSSGMVQNPMLKKVEKGTVQKEVRPVWNNAMRTNHQYFSTSSRNFAPTSVLTKFGIVPISTARQSSSRAASIVSAVRPINTVASKPLANFVNTAKGNKVTSVVGKQGIDAVKSLECWVWGPKHMIENISYLTDFKEHDEGYVAFEGGAQGGKITGKCTIRTGKLDFKDVYFVKELQFNLFSVSDGVILDHKY